MKKDIEKPVVEGVTVAINLSSYLRNAISFKRKFHKKLRFLQD